MPERAAWRRPTRRAGSSRCNTASAVPPSRARRSSWAAGGHRLTAALGSNSRDTTDDQGHYRLFGLPPGEYFVSATVRSGGPEAADPTGEVSGYAATYFPGTSNITEAARVTLAVSQENTTVPFGLIATKLVRLTGQVLTSAGAAAGAVVTGTVITDTGEPFDFLAQQLQVAARAVNIDIPGAGGGNSRVGTDWTFELRVLTDARLFRVGAPQWMRAASRCSTPRWWSSPPTTSCGPSIRGSSRQRGPTRPAIPSSSRPLRTPPPNSRWPTAKPRRLTLNSRHQSEVRMSMRCKQCAESFPKGQPDGLPEGG